MTQTNLAESEFTLRERAEMREANGRLRGLYSARQLDIWLAFVPLVMTIHTAAQRAAGADNPQYYSDHLRGLLKELMPNFMEGDDAREEFEHLVWLGEDADRQLILAEIRAKLIPSRHLTLATPKAARDAVQRVLDVHAAEERARKRAAKEAARLAKAQTEKLGD
ncbi:hypothetical protein [Rhizobium sp. RAF56]|uniref:hypothetical protein n=1 Tax=Rhizobium sp. RAF56 TaxID=3233062 RepID=UPI003F9E3818